MFLNGIGQMHLDKRSIVLKAMADSALRSLYGIYSQLLLM